MSSAGPSSKVWFILGTQAFAVLTERAEGVTSRSMGGPKAFILDSSPNVLDGFSIAAGQSSASPSISPP